VSTDEMSRLMKAIDQADDPDISDFIKLALFTGARRSNILAMEWKEIDLAARRWQIPSGKAKGKIPIVINLAPSIVQILARRRKAQRKKEPQFVFPGPGATGHMVEPKRAWTTIRKAAKLTDVTLHDLRRTLASWMAQRGMSLLEIGKALGHTSADATARYAHLVVESIAPGVNAVVDAMLATGKDKPSRKSSK
jgi:integrase